MSKTTKYVIFGGAAVVLLLLMRGNSSLSLPGLSVNPAPSTTASNVAAVGTAAGGILGGLKNLFSGSTTQPLTSGASPSNPNDLSNIDLVTGGQNINPLTGESDAYDV